MVNEVTPQQVLRAVQHARGSITQSIASLNSVLSGTGQAVDPGHVLEPLEAGLYDGFRSLLSTLRHATTSLSLAFKPPITTDAAVQQLERLEKTFGQCGTCVLAATGKSEGGKSGLLGEEWKDGVLEIGEAIKRYLAVLEETVKTGAGPSGTTTSSMSSGADAENNGAYLVYTGAVWESIDRLLNGTSASELDAFRKRWEEQRGVMKDAWEEFREVLEDAAADADGSDAEDEEDWGGDADDEDNEWAELERGLSGGKMSPEERQRAERAKNLLALHQILHASLPRFFDALSHASQTSYRPLLQASSAQVAAFDTAIDSLNPEQDVQSIDAALEGLYQSSSALAIAFQKRVAAENGVAATFITRWLAKASEEREKWSSQNFSVSGLQQALP